MSIRDRIDEAHLLFSAGKLEGALISACLAIAATSRKRYTKKEIPYDRKAFVQFLTDERSKYLNGNSVEIEFLGKVYSLEEMLYKFARNCLVHEGKLNEHISFEYGDFLFDKRGTTDYFTFSSELVMRLMWVVETAHENEGVFPTGGLDSLPEPIELKRFLDISYEFGDIHHRIFCINCSIVHAARDSQSEKITWVLFKGNQTFDGKNIKQPTLKLIVPATYVTKAAPGPEYIRTRKRQSSPDVGIIPPGKELPRSPMNLQKLIQVVNDLQIPMVRKTITLERPYYDAPSTS